MIIDKMRAMDGKWFDGRYVVRDMAGRVIADNFKTRERAQEWIDLDVATRKNGDANGISTTIV